MDFELTEDEIKQLFKQDLDQLKHELRHEAFMQIDEQIPKDTGYLRETLEVEWNEDDELVAKTFTDYDSFVRWGYVTELGNIVEGRDYFNVDLE